MHCICLWPVSSYLYHHNFAAAYNLFVCSPFYTSEDNVTFINTCPCQSAWPNAENCVELDLSIRIKLDRSTTANATNHTADIYTLKHDDLVRMWIEFGRKEFADNGFQVCRRVHALPKMHMAILFHFLIVLLTVLVIVTGISRSESAKHIIFLGHHQYSGDLRIFTGPYRDLQDG